MLGWASWWRLAAVTAVSALAVAVPCGVARADDGGVPCVLDGDCLPTEYCDGGGHCALRFDQGAACTASNQCLTTFCADGVCCDGPCAGQCAACNVALSQGTCVAVTGAPVAPRAACASDGGGICGGSCDGKNQAACAYPGGAAICRAADCSDMGMGPVATLQASCDGKGACRAIRQIACSPYQCKGGACPLTCGADADCIAGYHCSPKGRCSKNLGLGAACTLPNECTSGFCSDGVCCNADCGSQQCAACNGAGHCAAVAGPPVGGRPACDGAGPCQGTCDGVKAAACTYPDATVSCGAASCQAGLFTPAPACDGRGGCPATVPVACQHGCDGPMCALPDLVMFPDLTVVVPPDLAPPPPDLAASDLGVAADLSATTPDLGAGEAPDLSARATDDGGVVEAAFRGGGLGCGLGAGAGAARRAPCAPLALALVGLALVRRRRRA